ISSIHGARQLFHPACPPSDAVEGERIAVYHRRARSQRAIRRRRRHPQRGGPMTYGDVLYEKKGGIAWITINRPEVRNAFRTRTVAELTDAFSDARGDQSVGVVGLRGAGDKAFCWGGDQKERGQGGYAKDPAGGAASERPMDVEALHNA